MAPKGVMTSSKKGAVKKAEKHPLFLSTPKNYGIGNSIRPRPDLYRYVRWPRYIQLQKHRAILLQRLKVPPSVNVFRCAIDRNQASVLMRLLQKYRQETRLEKKDRLLKAAEAKTTGTEAPKRPLSIRSGIRKVTQLVETKRAKLVVIAHDVAPLEIVLWLPALCRKMDVPFCIVKSKARLGTLVGRSTVSCVAIENVRKEDQSELDNLVTIFRSEFNDNVELRRRWGGGVMGIKHRRRMEKRARIIAREQAKKMGA